MFSATCRLIIVGRCAWSRWSNQTRCPHFVPGGETTEGFGRCFTFLVAISLLTDSTKQPAGGRVVGRIATLVPTAPIAPIPPPDTRPCTGSRVPVETAADLGELMAPEPAPPPLPRRTLTPGSKTFERAPNLSLGSSQLAPIIKWVLVLHCKEDFFLVLL